MKNKLKVVVLGFSKFQNNLFLLSLFLCILTSACVPKWSEVDQDGVILVTNQGGQDISYSAKSGMELIIDSGFAFKDLNKNGSLDIYEDWRKSSADRAKDLASRMTIEQIAGLMLYSGHQSIPGGGYGGDTYDGKSFKESGAASSDLSDQQIKFLTDDNLRHVLITSVESPETAARWNNNAQELVEGIGLGTPVNISSDPRHEAAADEEYTLGAGGDISRWPPPIGLAASFDPALVENFGKIASREYRALGISTALSPQVDLATDPRWYRFSGTFGPSPELSIDMARAYVDGFQTSHGGSEIKDGWGYESVNAMVKHWPGGGTGEGGRDAHYGFGKFAVFPGDNLETHMRPFLEGAFALKGGTQKASAVMPYYTISTDKDPSGKNVGNAFSKYFITDKLREEYGYDGVICTDWGVTSDDAGMAMFGRTPWGVEHLSEVEKHYEVIMAGCDQFGGNNESEPVMGAYKMGVKEIGEETMRRRFEDSASRLLKNIFNTGLFENPYLDIDKTKEIVGNSEYMKEGFDAQLKSVVMLKNKEGVMPIAKESKVYVPNRFTPPSQTFFGGEIPGKWEDAMDAFLLKEYFTATKDPADADVAIVVIETPKLGRTAGYDATDAEKGGNGFFPISLQYETYTAMDARNPSLAGDTREGDVLNRTYQGKTVTPRNLTDLELVRKTVGEMEGKPVVVVIKMSNPTILAEFEAQIDGLIVNFGVQDQALLDIISGEVQPSGLLPFQIPANMGTVEKQFEDVPFDMEVHIDTEKHAYDFGYGLNWSGMIEDSRTKDYAKLD